MTRLNAFLTAIVCFIMAGPASAQQQNLNSFFPSPFGSYKQLRLVPRLALPEPCQIGTLYYEIGAGLKFCSDPQDGTSNGLWGEGNGVWSKVGDRIFLPGDATSQLNLKVGIGTTTPLVKLHIINGGILSSGQFGQGDVLTPPGNGPRFLWRSEERRVGKECRSRWS